jgi:hypothetical protein
MSFFFFRPQAPASPGAMTIHADKAIVVGVARDARIVAVRPAAIHLFCASVSYRGLVPSGGAPRSLVPSGQTRALGATIITEGCP